VGEKTEQATPRKLQQARKKGQVAKSQDFPSAFTFVVAIGTVVATSSSLYEQLASLILYLFNMAGQPLDWQSAAPSILYLCLMTIFQASMPVVLITLFVGVIVNFLIVGPMWASEALKFDLKKLNPIDNLKQKFKLRTLMELLKSILKIAGAAYLVYTVIRDAMPEVLATVQMPPIGAALVLESFLTRVIIKVGIFFLAVAVADLFLQKRFFSKEMMMEKYEVKQEYKDTEGDPHIKGKRRQIAQETAYQDSGVVKKARAVVTNPTHIAVAIGYEKSSPAPYVLAMGVGMVAEEIILIAEQSGIPIVRNVPLAHSLREKAKVNEYVPEELYEPMAEVLRLVFELYPDLNPLSGEET
jgi:type III secretion protein U